MRGEQTKSSVRVSIPRSLYQQILTIQVNDGLDFNDAASKAANLVLSNGELFQEAVRRAAQELGQSQFLKQLNTSRATIQKVALAKGIDMCGIRKLTSVPRAPNAGKLMRFSDRYPNWEKVKSALYGAFNNWNHVTCPT